MLHFGTMRATRLLPLSFAVPLALAACGSDADDGMPDAPGEIARSGLQRQTNPNVPAADQAQLVEGNTAFALDLYAKLSSEPGNVFYSPHSISTALAMTYAGARGTTETQMADALEFRLPQSQLHPAFNWLDLELESRGQGASGADGQPFRLRVANALFAQTGYHFESAFLDTLALNYGAGVNLLDFVEETEPSRDKINAWVDEATEGRIDELIPQGVLTPATVLVLTNAVYFNASWATPFEEDQTTDEPFTTPNGTVTARMMHNSAELTYAQGSGYQAVALPYDGDELDMVVVVPDAGTLGAFEASLDAAKLDEVFTGLSSAQVQLGLPKFETRFKTSLVEHMKALGMIDAFSGEADLSGMDGTRSLFIQDILHEAFVKVNEAGTEAAAATAVVVGRTSVPPQQVTLTVDRPFLFFIRDRATGAVVFAGRIVDPT